jgi:hypothetical protein
MYIIHFSAIKTCNNIHTTADSYQSGGEHEPRVPIGSTVHRLDLETKEWSECKPINNKPVPVNAATVCSIGETIYIYIFLEEDLKKSLKITKG